MARCGDGADFLKAPDSRAAADFVRGVMRADRDRMAVLAAVSTLALSDGWVAAGFVRAAVWDALHGFETATPLDDIDVVYFDPRHVEPENDRELEAALRRLLPGLPWSVRNQARMHTRNGDRPYRSSADAMAHWLETPTAVGLALRDSREIGILAPFGLDDLLDIVIRPTPHARAHRPDAFRERVQSKPWLRQWPLARLEMPDGSP